MTVVQASPAIFDALDGFAASTWHQVGIKRQFLTINDAREMSRFLRHSGTLQSKIRLKEKALPTNRPMMDPTVGVWMAAAEFVETYDGANCVPTTVPAWRASPSLSNGPLTARPGSSYIWIAIAPSPG
ncbi:hypothetical protein NVS55_07695 [Myxococcus stipitatus]|uniref:hypothetical protein n=1 Tax=Myxococcus stipitatus TaxID=83455 RepID=UPI00314568B1